jgi:hypothetical protein
MQAIELGIKTKKVVYRGLKCYKILDFTCYEDNDVRLPSDYFKEYPFCFKDDDEFVLGTNDKSLINEWGNDYSFKVGDYIPKEKFEKVIEAVKVCGEKLHNLNVKIKEMKKEWKGIEEFKI